MLTLEQIIATAYNNRDVIADDMADAFTETLYYDFEGKYYPATMWEPAEYPDAIVDGYEDYKECAVKSVMGIFGDFWNTAEEQIVVDNITKIMSEIDVDFLSEDAYYDKGVDYAYEHYWEKENEAKIKAEDAYYERLIDQKLESRFEG